eukprot:4900482-Amphidinium_carterae.1
MPSLRGCFQCPQNNAYVMALGAHRTLRRSDQQSSIAFVAQHQTFHDTISLEWLTETITFKILSHYV